ncbi:MAG: type II toxin-antitoxin system death-on-curing family toxin [Candidatus Methylomirabilales bacterium]
MYLSEEDICRINADLIASFGGWQVSYPNLRAGFDLRYMLDAIRHPVFGVDLFQSAIDKAAGMAWYLITRHPFHDTNKRTALESAIEFLEINGFYTRFAPADVIVTVIRASDGDLTYQEFRNWIAANASRESV